MASTSQKVPIPLPTEGVVLDRSTREVGPRGLVGASNWIYQGGRFRVRPGLEVVQAIDRNLFALIDAIGVDEDTLAYINDEDYFEVSQAMQDNMFFAGTFGPSEFLYEWKGWAAADAALLSGGLIWKIYNPVTDPPFCNHTNFPEYRLPGTASSVTFCSPIVAASQGAYEAQIKVATDSPNPYPDVSVKLEMCFVKLTMNGSIPIWTGDGVAQPYVAGSTIEDAGVFSTSDPDPIRVTGENDGYYNYAFLRVTFLSSPVGYSVFFGEAMINRGDGDATFAAPSSYEQPQIGRAQAVYIYESDPGSPVTVLATNTGFYELDGSLEWSAIEDGVWSSGVAQADNSLPVFRTFDAALSGGAAERYMIVCNGESGNMYWDGTNPMDLITLDDSGNVADKIVSKCVAISNNRVLYGNVTTVPGGAEVGPDTIVWTEDLQISEWAPGSVTNRVRLADTPGPIIAMMEMSNLQTAVYKTDAIYMAVGQGGIPPFRFELRTANIDGPASPLSIVALSDGVHMYLSETGDVIMFDGVRPRSMGAHLQYYIQGDMDIDRMDRSFGFYDKENKLVYFFYPPYNAASGYKCISIDVSGDFPRLWPMQFKQDLTAGGRLVLNISKTIDQLAGTIDQLQGTINDFGEVRPLLALLDSSGSIYIFEGYTDLGLPIAHYLETGLYDLGSITNWKTIKEIDHLFDAGSGQTINIELLTTNYGGEKVSDGVQSMALTRNTRKLSSHRSTGRLFSLRITGEADRRVEWLGSEASVAIRGLR